MENKELLLPKHLFPMVAGAVRAVGSFALEQLRGGGWSNIGKSIEEPPTPANITVYNNEDPHEHDADFKE